MFEIYGNKYRTTSTSIPMPEISMEILILVGIAQKKSILNRIWNEPGQKDLGLDLLRHFFFTTWTTKKRWTAC